MSKPVTPGDVANHQQPLLIIPWRLMCLTFEGCINVQTRDTHLYHVLLLLPILHVDKLIHYPGNTTMTVVVTSCHFTRLGSVDQPRLKYDIYVRVIL